MARALEARLARLEAVAQGDTTRPPRRIVCFIGDAEGATYMHRNTLMLRDFAYFCFTTPKSDVQDTCEIAEAAGGNGAKRLSPLFRASRAKPNCRLRLRSRSRGGFRVVVVSWQRW